ncbi:hypothetical protein K438DRAFT_1537523, partial [Mycena galopus ATCC 62051]
YPDLRPFVHRRLPLGSSTPQHNELFERVIHPYNTSEFEHLLKKHNLSDRYPQLVNNLTHGFP